MPKKRSSFSCSLAVTTCAVSGDDVRRDQVVAGEAVLRRQPSVAATGREAAHAGRRDAAARSRETECLGFTIELAPEDAAAAAYRPLRTVNVNALQQREIEQQSTFRRAVPGDAMPAAANGNRQPGDPRLLHGRADVDRAAGPNHERRPTVDRAVVHTARDVVFRIIRIEQRPPDVLAKPLRNRSRDDRLGHASPFGRRARRRDYRAALGPSQGQGLQHCRSRAET